MKRRTAMVLMCLIICAVWTNKVTARQGGVTADQIAVLARPLKDSVMLRWAPSTPSLWYNLNKNGYLIARFTILRDGTLLTDPEKITLTPKPLKPLPLAAWKVLADKDKYAAIAAQALYGDDFIITQQNRSNISTMINKVQEEESRYSIALFSADLSFNTAKTMSLAYVDKTAKINEKYVYRIYPAVESKYSVIDTGFVYTGFSDYKKLPMPTNPGVEVRGKGVMISWDNGLAADAYTAYIVEKSEDGGATFVSLSNAPVINTSNAEDATLKRISKTDTLVSFNRQLVYRVKGISPFGEIGPPSDTVSIIIRPELNKTPVIATTNITINNQVIISWDFANNKAEITGFDLERSSDPLTGFKKINEAVIESKIRNYTDSNPFSSNYYRVKVHGKYDDATVSLPVFVQLVDSIAPIAPVDIKAEITKEGIVKLSWKKNAEADLYGYRVFRSNSEEGEFSQVSRKPVITNTYTDTIEVRTLAKKIYYKIVAIDKHFNPSGFSDVLSVNRPDVVPPVPPSITQVTSGAEGIYLFWIRSSSDDVIKHEVYRSKAGDEMWKALIQFSDSTSAYADTTADVSTAYTYKIKAVDNSLLFSESAAFTAKRIDAGIKPEIISFKGYAQRDDLQIALKWVYTQANLESFLLYKSEVGKPLRLYKTLDSDHTGFVDKELYINTQYRYCLKAVFKDGSESGFATIQIKY